NVGFDPVPPAEQRQRLPIVLHVLYLIFSEGYAATSGESGYRVDLSTEAIRDTRLLLASSDDPEVTARLALMLRTEARRDARTWTTGDRIRLGAQNRALWNRAMIREGVLLLDGAMARARAGPYQIQAAIAALHDEASSTETTDWVQILGLYGALLRVADSPMARLSHAIALAMVEGPSAGLKALDVLANDPRLAHNHRVEAARGHRPERAGDFEAAVACYRRAAEKTASLPERDYLLVQAARLAEPSAGGA